MNSLIQSDSHGLKGLSSHAQKVFGWLLHISIFGTCLKVPRGLIFVERERERERTKQKFNCKGEELGVVGNASYRL